MKNIFATIFAAAFLLMFSASPSFAATITYLGSDGVWFNGSNWTGGNTPGSFDNADITSGGTAGQPVVIGSGTGAVSINMDIDSGNEVQVSGGSTLNLSNALTVGNASGSTSKMAISGNSQVTALTTQISAGAGGQGSITISGAGSKLDTPSLIIGVNSAGSVTVDDGGELASSGTIYVGSTGNGTLNVGTFGNTHGIVNASAIELGTANSVLRFNFTDSYALNATITGAGKVELNGGTTTLQGVNTYTGGTEIANSGTTLIVTNANGTTSSSVGTGTVAITGGTFKAGASGLDFANAFSIGTNSSNTIDNDGNALTLSGAFTGNGNLLFQGNGTTTISHANTGYTGNFRVATGSALNITDADAMGTNSMTLFRGATLQISNTGLTINNNIVLGSTGSGDAMIVNANDAQLSGVISGSQNLIKDGAGTLTLSGVSTMSGNLDIVQGAVELNGTFGTATISLQSGANLKFNGSPANIANDITLATTGANQFDTGNNTAYLTGQINGAAGVLQKAGAGTLVLSNANLYQGGTTLLDGQITLTNASALGTGLVVMNSGTRVAAGANNMIVANDFLTGCSCIPAIFDTGSNDMALTGQIFGAGQFQKTGSGTLSYNGDGSSYSGTFYVSDGKLVVGDAAHASTVLGDGGALVLVLNGGTLSGHGTIAGSLGTNGTISPGGSIGTLNVTGVYVQGPTGTLAISVSPAGSSLLAVQGGASLNGALRITFEPGVYAPKTYTFLTAANGVTGTFQTMQYSQIPDSGVELIASAPIYTANSVSFTLSGVVVAGVSNNNAASFNGLTSTRIESSINASDIIFNQLGGNTIGTNNAQSSALAFTNSSSQIVNAENAAGINDLARALPNVMKERGGWFKAYGNLGSVSSNSTSAGYDSQSGGFLFGVDQALSKTLRVGAAGGYEHTNLNGFTTFKTDGEANTMRFALYGRQMAFDDIAFDAQVGYAFHALENKRFVFAAAANATSEHNAHEFSGGLQASKNFRVSGFTLIPRAGLHFTYLYEEGFSESGAGAFNATFASKDTNSLRLFTGFTAVAPIQDVYGIFVTPEARIKYSYEALDNARQAKGIVGATAFTATGVAPSEHVIALGTGFTAKLDEIVDGFISYDMNLPTSNNFDQTFALGVKVKF